MKCQHCGINYNDEDRECPICGARTGTRGRVGELEKKAAAWREQQFADEPTYQKTRTRKAPVRAQKARASVKPIREAPKGKGKIAVVVIIAVILINILPSLLPAARNLIDNFLADFSSFEINLGDGGAYEPDAEAEADDWVSYDDGAMYYERGQEYTYDSDNYISIYAALYDLTGEYAVATLADGTTLELQVEPGEMGNYTLRLNDGTGTYEEKGYTWCIYNYPEEGIYNDNFSPAQYDSLTLALSCNEWSYNGNLYERYDTRQENTDLWLVAYVDRETGQVTLQDAEQMGIFGTPALVPLTSVQTG